MAKSTRLFFCLSASLLFACSDDNNNTGGTPDAPATSTADAGPGTTLTATLNRAGEPSPCGPTPGGTGTATVVVSGDNSTVTVDVTYTGMSQAVAKLGHIHFGTTTDNGPVALNFGSGAALTSPIHKVFTSADYSPGAGTPTAPATFADFVTQLKMGGKAYVNLHTDACGGGEIRGELNP